VIKKQFLEMPFIIGVSFTNETRDRPANSTACYFARRKFKGE
jgi:hypothetical protein